MINYKLEYLTSLLSTNTDLEINEYKIDNIHHLAHTGYKQLTPKNFHQINTFTLNKTLQLLIV